MKSKNHYTIKHNKRNRRNTYKTQNREKKTSDESNACAAPFNRPHFILLKFYFWCFSNLSSRSFTAFESKK